jgi:hypothetical protein
MQTRSDALLTEVRDGGHSEGVARSRQYRAVAALSGSFNAVPL